MSTVCFYFGGKLEDGHTYTHKNAHALAKLCSKFCQRDCSSRSFFFVLKCWTDNAIISSLFELSGQIIWSSSHSLEERLPSWIILFQIPYSNCQQLKTIRIILHTIIWNGSRYLSFVPPRLNIRTANTLIIWCSNPVLKNHAPIYFKCSQDNKAQQCMHFLQHRTGILLTCILVYKNIHLFIQELH